MTYPTHAKAIPALLALWAGTVLAQNTEQGKFVGPGIGLTVAAVQNKLEFESGVASINGQNAENNESDVALIASYGFPLTSDWVGTLGLSYGLKSADAGSISYTYSGSQTISTKLKEHLSLSFAPGYRLDSNALVYGKLSYHQIKGEYNDTYTTGGSTDHNGTGFGFGLAFSLAPSFELRTEYETVKYSSSKVRLTTGTPAQSAVTLAVLYKF